MGSHVEGHLPGFGKLSEEFSEVARCSAQTQPRQSTEAMARGTKVRTWV